MPGTRIADEDRKKIDEKFICTSCDMLLCMPMQTQCGHLMCSSCLQTLLEYVNFPFITIEPASLVAPATLQTQLDAYQTRFDNLILKIEY
jgi:hypothetical protein